MLCLVLTCSCLGLWCGVYGGCGLFWLLCLCFFLDYWFGCVLGCALVGVIAVWDGFVLCFR